jgi:hypothetical protein
MYKVEVIKRCGCFTKSDLPHLYEFDTKSAAEAKANELAAKFNEDFCGKHKFKIKENGNTLEIIEDEDA